MTYQSLRSIFVAAVLGAIGWPTSAAALERWVYCAQNLLVDQNTTNLIALMQRAHQAGYTHILLSDSKFGHLADLDSRYFQNVAKIMQAATTLNLEIVPTVFPVGYANDLLYNDPNLIEGMPVQDALLVVTNGVAAVQADPPVGFLGGDF